MASSSASTSQWKYVVFLSFRGEDTRKTFTSHLFKGLDKRGISTFKDDERLEYGNMIPEKLMNGIKDSKVALIIFSKNYATSRWCLNELVKIMECKDKNGQIVIPIFYDVDPSHVRNQKESFANAFTEHELKYKGDGDEGMQKVQGWRNALTAAANLKGFDIRDGIESDNIQQIVDHISKLCKSAYFLYSQDIVGVDTHLEKVESLLSKEIDDVRIVGIWGMGGIGKTTIATTIFHKYNLSGQFEGACFLDDVKENAKKNGLCSLQNILLSELLGKKDNYVTSKQVGKCMIPSRLCSMKVLIVLDDIDHSDHLEYLAGDVRWFGNGSRVIVTTRNRDVIKIDDGLESQEQEIFLDIACFFRGYRRKEVVHILENCNFEAEGGLDVLIDKSLLFLTAYDRIEMHDLIQDMGKYIVNLPKNPGERSRLWDAEDFKQVMGDNTGTIAVEAIWVIDDFEKLCFSKEAMKNMRRLRILYIISSIYPSSVFNCHEGSIEYLPNNLRWFVWNIYPWESLPENFEPERLVHLDLWESSLRHLWTTTKTLPFLRTLNLSSCKNLMRTPDFSEMPNLEELNLSDCTSLEEVHHSLKCCGKLKSLYLSHCESLVRFPWVNVESLEYLTLNYCRNLEKFPEILGIMKPELKSYMGDSGIRELPPSFFQHQTHLTMLYLGELKNLVALPSSICKLKGLVKLNVSDCSKLESLPEEIGDLENLKELDASGTLISRPPSSIVHLIKLKYLSFEKLKSEDGVFFVFPQVNEGLSSLEELNLNSCNLRDGGLPVDIGCLSSLKKLYLMGNKFEQLPRSISQLGALRSLHLSHCKRLKELPDFMGMTNLETLNLNYCNLIDGRLPKDMGFLSSLKELCLRGHNFEHLPPCVAQFSALRSLDLSFCKRLKEFPHFMGMPNLETLKLSFCNLMDGGFPEDIGCLSSLKVLYLSGNNFEHLPRRISQLGAIRSLFLLHCKRLKQLPEFPEQLYRIEADWSNDWICNSLFRNISSLQHDISASDSLSLRVFASCRKNIPSWFHHRGSGRIVSVNLPENWYVSNNFLGFAVCYSSKLIDTTAHLISLCDDGMSSMTQKLALSNHSKWGAQPKIHFFLVPFAGLWDTSKANGRTPNDYGHVILSFSEELKECGVRLLYKDENNSRENDELEALLQRLHF